MGRPRRPLGERLWSRVQKTPGCWLWTGFRVNGYGQIGIGGGAKRQRMGAHRAAWILTHGEIPDGMCVLHRCDTPLCVRPDHLFLGTLADNNADAAAKGRSASGERHGRAVLKNDQVREIRRLHNEGVLGSDLARQFETSQAQISLIVHRRTWRSI